MRSVLIINSEIIDKYQKYAYFFTWFEDHSDLSVCLWNKYASPQAGIDEMVPQLSDVVGGTTEWNAYIVDEPFDSGKYIEKDFENFTQCSLNPYERAGHSKTYDPEKDPLLRLLYGLGGRGVEELEYLGEYSFRASHPLQICLLTPRIFEDLEMQKHLLCTSIEEERRKRMKLTSVLPWDEDTVSLPYAEFWERYEYPPCCRFLVFDMPKPENVRYQGTWLLFWMAVMTLILNSCDSEELGPYKLYRLSLELSPEGLEDFLNTFYAALNGACEDLDAETEEEIRSIRAAMEDTTCHHPDKCAPIYVNFPDTDLSAFSLDGSRFGLTKDQPELDTDVWSEHVRERDIQTGRLFKAITRGKNEAVDEMNRTLRVDIPFLRTRHLSRYDAEDIVDMLNKDEIDMLSLETDKTASRASFEERRREPSQVIVDALPERVPQSTFIKLLLTAGAICLMGFIPFIISSAKFSITSCMIACLIAGFSCAAVLGVGYIALAVLRKKLGEKLSDYNEAVNDSLHVIVTNAETQGQYLSMLLDYMEKYQMLTYGRIEELHTKRLDELAHTRASYEEALDQCRAAAALCSVELTREAEFLPGQNALFIRDGKIYLHDDTDSLLIPLNESEDRLIPPFSFVRGLQIIEETIYESEKYFGYADDPFPEEDAPEGEEGEQE